jgi:hypothetical protein
VTFWRSLAEHRNIASVNQKEAWIPDIHQNLFLLVHADFLYRSELEKCSLDFATFWSILYLLKVNKKVHSIETKGESTQPTVETGSCNNWGSQQLYG